MDTQRFLRFMDDAIARVQAQPRQWVVGWPLCPACDHTWGAIYSEGTATVECPRCATASPAPAPLVAREHQN